MAQLHGAEVSVESGAKTSGTLEADFAAAYAAYTEATVQANQALKTHGKNSAQFTVADIASMRLFHRVKKMQGLKKAARN
jgi:hypothetical protein